MKRTGLLALAVCVCGALIGCGDDDSSVPPAPGTHPLNRDAGMHWPVSPPTPGPDAGDQDGGDELFASDSGIRVDECTEVTPVPFVGEDMPGGEVTNAIAAPTDLMASRIVATWSGRCEPPVMVVMMTDGDCPDGDGHELTFELAIDGRLSTGLHDIVADADAPIRVRYTRPARLDPSGVWGNCGAVTGTLSVIGELATSALQESQASFEMDLPPCDGSDQPIQHVQGTFHVRLRRPLDEVCPH